MSILFSDFDGSRLERERCMILYLTLDGEVMENGKSVKRSMQICYKDEEC